jgi:hypothetical protein
MHNSLSEGLTERNELKIDQYHAWVAKEIAGHIMFLDKTMLKKDCW